VSTEAERLRIEQKQLQGVQGDLQRVNALFDWTRQAAERFKGSSAAGKRGILTAVSLSRTLGDVTLCLQKRKPFDLLAERLSATTNRGD
jgi:hypothetical protein